MILSGNPSMTYDVLSPQRLIHATGYSGLSSRRPMCLRAIVRALRVAP